MLWCACDSGSAHGWRGEVGGDANDERDDGKEDEFIHVRSECVAWCDAAGHCWRSCGDARRFNSSISVFLLIIECHWPLDFFYIYMPLTP